MNKFRLQLVSDLHLKFNKYSNSIIKPSANYLAILGDVDEFKSNNLKLFLKEICPQFKSVFYIPGNHEYYFCDMSEFDEFKKWSDTNIPNLELLNNRSVIVDGYKILGSTLWSYIPKDNRQDVLKRINDYKYITNNNKLLTIDDTVKFHINSCTWLNKEINESKEKLIILTHHAPLRDGTSSNVYNGSATNCAFSTDLSGLFKDNVILWAFGHTHHHCNFKFRDTQVVSNPYGYGHSDPCNKFYNPEFVVEL